MNGKKTGYGILHYKNSGQYSGEWLNDQFHGSGKLTFPLGEVYEGDFAYGLRNGEGVFSFLDGSSFSGKFISDNGMEKVLKYQAMAPVLMVIG